MGGNNGTAAARLVAELRRDGLDAVADVIGWAIESKGSAATDLPALTKFADWCRAQQAARDAEAVLSLAELVALTGQSQQGIVRSVRDGLPHTPRGYPVKGLIAYLWPFKARAIQAEKHLNNLRSETGEHKRLKTEDLAMQVAERKGRLHDAVDCGFRQVQKALRVRTALQRIPPNAKAARGLSDADVTWLTDELRRICDEFGRSPAEG